MVKVTTESSPEGGRKGKNKMIEMCVWLLEVSVNFVECFYLARHASFNPILSGGVALIGLFFRCLLLVGCVMHLSGCCEGITDAAT